MHIDLKYGQVLARKYNKQINLNRIYHQYLVNILSEIIVVI
jgi:hypothetical protein